MINNMEKEAAVLKIFMLGDSGAGKSQIISKFVGLLTDTNTIGVESRSKIVSYKDKTYKLVIFDTAGQERFKVITSTYYKGADGIMIVYSDSQSYSNCLNWYQQILGHRLKIPVLVIQNRSDDNPSVDDSQHPPNELSAPIIVVNAETGLNLNAAFMTLVDMIIQKNSLTETPETPNLSTTITQEDHTSNIIPSNSQFDDVKRSCLVF
jgi:Ras-related protein Rab-1A